jgi:hypothetical protein
LPVPDNTNVAVAAARTPVAVTDPPTRPGAVGANCAVKVHVLLGPRLVPVQWSAVIVNAAAPDCDSFNAVVAIPPALVNVNVCDTDWPTSTLPKPNGDAGLNTNDGGADEPYATPADANAHTNTTVPNSAANFTRLVVRSIMPTPMPGPRRTGTYAPHSRSRKQGFSRRQCQGRRPELERLASAAVPILFRRADAFLQGGQRRKASTVEATVPINVVAQTSKDLAAVPTS